MVNQLEVIMSTIFLLRIEKQYGTFLINEFWTPYLHLIFYSGVKSWLWSRSARPPELGPYNVLT